MRSPFITILMFVLATQAHSLESVVISDKVSTTALGRQLATSNDTSLTTLMNKVQTCIGKSMVYSTSGGGDADGCVNTAIAACAKAGKLYAPGRGGADGNGCVALPTGRNYPICPANHVLRSNGSAWTCYRPPQTFALGSSCGGALCNPDASTGNYLCQTYGFTSAMTYYQSGSNNCNSCTYAYYTGAWAYYSRCNGCGNMTAVTCQ